MPTLLIVAGSHGVGRLIRIEQKGKMVIGRGDECHVWIDDESISRRHAEIERSADGIQLVDLESRNGTYINGEKVVTAVALKDGDRILLGSTTIMKFSFRDSLDEALQLHLYEAATRDGLTGLHNKKFFTEAVEREFTFAIRHSSPLSVLLIDLDHFKAINDVHGHVIGDRVLAQTAEAVSKTLRSGDVFARWGGEEFVQMLRQCSLEDAVKVAERLRNQIEQLNFVNCETGLRVTASIGVATLTAGVFDNATGLVESADLQLYRAKKAGRNRVFSRLIPEP